MSMLDAAKQWARKIKRDVVALWIAARDPRVPWYAKATAGAVAAYALSPVDLIPDFIPIIGYLDDLLIVPVGIMLAVKLVPADLMGEFREEAMRREKPVSKAGLAFMIALWTLAALTLTWLCWPKPA
ncbi:YkvA family protein [Mesorhizobium sp. WSM4935]|uniref:YkvA family protein n=1 Tax=Mesorhizobium sp. WSM4935 TaxID=3038547 RepID=UPI0024151F23|nr:YkvA family protein [Mesorhizobium sp. WSM4935]MDG4876912.1 YkvA family protein [Mesorhizobium sp. WSM4935]